MIGTHIKKDKTFYKSLSNFYSTGANFNTPCQIFTGSTKMWKRPALNEEDNNRTMEYIEKNDISLFIHSLYLINLGRNSEECQKGLEALVYDLELGTKLGAKGVVVHCGKSLKMEKSKAIDNMYNNIISVLEHVNVTCPLLIETSSQQGSELLNTYEEFSDFYNRFTKEQKEKVKICIDTCHVWSTFNGYYPSIYTENWLKDNPGSLVLVHYNDSKYEKGSNKDRHALVGKGTIGVEEMNKVYKICSDNNIPMVTE